MAKKKSEHYVNNAEFYDALKQHRAVCVVAKALKKETPPISEFIGECFLKIAKHLSFKPNFMNYTYRDDMIMDGVENCLVYVHNFDPEKTNNPFSYFTTIIWYAFLRRIAKEKRETYIKYKALERAHVEGTLFSDIDGVAGSTQMDSGMLAFENIQDFIKRFEENAVSKRARRHIKRTA